ncbi:tripartite tricarboxylate transporter substrate-binding protein [Variovorax ureilyticus]|uniref:tripartite tricarboxylate transporter substrate-binding protein n=1 Tax=Variovorax ureilyticus TaxID=1836198 RepID=UPI003D67CE21
MESDLAFPHRPIRLVVSHLRSDAIHGIARVLARKLSLYLCQPVEIDSRPGTGGSLGLATLARSAPDGYTLLMTSARTMSISRYLFNHAPLDPPGGFVPVVLMCPLPQGTVKACRPMPDVQRNIDWLIQRGSQIEGVYAPPGTPRAIVDRLALGITRMVGTFDVHEELDKHDIDLVVLTGPALRAYLDGK